MSQCVCEHTSIAATHGPDLPHIHTEVVKGVNININDLSNGVLASSPPAIIGTVTTAGVGFAVVISNTLLAGWTLRSWTLGRPKTVPRVPTLAPHSLNRYNHEALLNSGEEHISAFVGSITPPRCVEHDWPGHRIVEVLRQLEQVIVGSAVERHTHGPGFSWQLICLFAAAWAVERANPLDDVKNEDCTS